MSNDNFQGMPPAPPQNMPPRPPQPPQPSNNQPQGSYYQQPGVGYQPPAPPQQPAGTYYQQPQPAASYQTSMPSPQGLYASMPSRPQPHQETGPATIAGATLSLEPHHNLRNMLAETFVQCINFKDCTTRLTWWFGQTVLSIFYLICIKALAGVPVLIIVPYVYFTLCRISLCSRRINDTGRPSGWMFLPILAVIVEVLCIVLTISPDAIYYAYVVALLLCARFVLEAIVSLTFGVFRSTPITKYNKSSIKPRYINYV